MKKVTILVLHLGYGGIENIATTLANTLSSDYDVEILSVYRMYQDPVYKLNDNIKVRYVSTLKPNKKEMLYYLKKKNFKMFFSGLGQSLKTGYIKYIKTAIELSKLDTDVIISTRIFHNKLVSTFAPKNIKKIAWDHNHHNGDKGYIKSLINSCKNIDNLVTVSNELMLDYKTYLNDKVVFIPNCLDDSIRKVSKLESKNIISVGRLAKEKGFDDLLKLYKRISNKYPDWKLNIVGDGTEKTKLLELTEELKLTNKVIFHGYQNKEYINNLLNDSSIFVLTSHTESFGLVVIEAMACGIPCVSYTSAQGVNEIIDNEENGFLIKNRNQDEMVEKISLLIEDEKLRKKMGKNAKEKSKNYDSNVILEEWKKIINKRK